MALTLTDRLALPQWGAGSDGPSRVQLNDALKRINDRVAYDDGAAGGTTLPSTDVVNGRYAQTVEGSYRRLYRRAGGAWTQVGGNTWGEPTYLRGDAGFAVDSAARTISHPNLSNPTLVENWDGSAVRSNRQAIGDANGTPAALHVGDTASAVDLATRGRIYARTTADGQRAVVASAHGNGAGNLFSAVESGGAVPWQVDAQGRMRAQAPTSFGSAALTAGVPLAASPGASDNSGADFIAASGKPALRVLRAPGDIIASYGADSITLGKTSWTGGQIRATAPTITLDGNVTVTGTLALPNGTISAADLPGNLTLQQLTVSGTSTLQGATTASAITAGNLTATGALSAHDGALVSVPSGSSGAELRTRPGTQHSGTNLQSVRAPMMYVRSVVANLVVPTTEVSTQAAVVMPEDGWMRLDLTLSFEGDVGAGGMETFKVLFRVDLLNNSGATLQGSAQHVATVTSDATERQKPGVQVCHLTEIYSNRLTAGNYQIKVRMLRHGVLGGKLTRIQYAVTSVVLHSASLAAI